MDIKKKGLLVAVCGILLVALAMPVSNYFLPRETIVDKSGDPRFAEVSKIMQISCADCHSPGLTAYPIYTPLPGAATLIARDIKEAQEAFILTRQQLSGEEAINGVDLAKIATVIKDNSMPPANYLSLHWNSRLANDQKARILGYVQAKQEDSGVALAPLPGENPFQIDAGKAALGEKLFSDKRLSAGNSRSCASCHALEHGGTGGGDSASCALNTPTVYNSAYNFAQYWDGRAKDLPEQLNEHLVNPEVMGTSYQQILGKIKDDPTYSAMSKAAYGAPLSETKIRDSLVAFEKSLDTPNSAFDKYLRGDEKALNDEEKRGYQLFMENGCATCHTGATMGGMSFEKMGAHKDYFAGRAVSQNKPATVVDYGRYNATANPLDRYKFKVPSLRNIALTGPYFHDGSAATLSDAVASMAEYQAGKKLDAADNAAIVAFLKTLTGEYKGRKLQ